MSRRAKARDPVREAKHADDAAYSDDREGLDEWDDRNDRNGEPCAYCHGDGSDKWSDYLLPCPECQGMSL